MLLQMLKRHCYYILKTCFKSLWRMFYLAGAKLRTQYCVNVNILLTCSQCTADQNSTGNLGQSIQEWTM